MGEWKQWRELFKKHKETWKERAFGKQSPKSRKYKDKQDDAIKNIENLVNSYWPRLNLRDRDKINKLLYLIKDKAVHSGEKASAISAIERILKRQAI